MKESIVSWFLLETTRENYAREYGWNVWDIRWDSMEWTMLESSSAKSESPERIC